MARKKKLLPKDFVQVLASGADLPTLQAVFDACEVDARGGYAKETALMMPDCPDELARWLVGRGADVAAVDTFGNTALHVRARCRRPSRGSMAVLFELGCDVDAATSSSGTPLHAAADTKHVGAVGMLIAQGARVDATDRQGLTPLEVALRGCTNADLTATAKVARILLDAGAPRTPAMAGFVKRAGETFEFHRSNFNPEFLEETSAALVTLCEMFGVEPPARRQMHDGSSPISVTSSTWQARHKELWNLLVPSSGAASTVQGEVVRISGRIGDKLHRNGGANWDADYKAMARAFAAHVQTGTPLPEAELRDGAAIVASLAKGGQGDADRLSELAVAWVLLNPQPVALAKPTYRR